jgi:hypothetical protein
MIVFKVILAIIILYAGKMTWQVFKRGLFLKKISNSQAEMAAFISIETFDAFSQKNPVYVNKVPGGYVGNISLLIDIDLTTQRRSKLLFGSITIFALIINAYVSSGLFLINVSLFLLTGIYPLTEAGRRNACELLITLGAILYKWRQENQKECDEWIEQASSLKELYALIQAMKWRHTHLL